MPTEGKGMITALRKEMKESGYSAESQLCNLGTIITFPVFLLLIHPAIFFPRPPHLMMSILNL